MRNARSDGEERRDEAARALRERQALREALAGLRRGLGGLAVRLDGRNAASALAHAAASLRPPPVIAMPSSSSLAVGGNSPTISPSYMTRIRSESERISSSSSETSRIAAALVALLDEPAVDELDRADVEAARRLRGDQHPRVALDLAREDDLLLVAARERRPRGVCGPPPRTSNSWIRRRARSTSRRGKSQPKRESGGWRKSWSAMFSASVNSSTRPRRWRSSGMCPTPASRCSRARCRS